MMMISELNKYQHQLPFLKSTQRNFLIMQYLAMWSRVKCKGVGKGLVSKGVGKGLVSGTDHDVDSFIILHSTLSRTCYQPNSDYRKETWATCQTLSGRLIVKSIAQVGVHSRWNTPQPKKARCCITAKLTNATRSWPLIAEHSIRHTAMSDTRQRSLNCR